MSTFTSYTVSPSAIGYDVFNAKGKLLGYIQSDKDTAGNIVYDAFVCIKHRQLRIQMQFTKVDDATDAIVLAARVH